MAVRTQASEPEAGASAPVMIDRVCFGYERQRMLDEVSFSIHAGEVCCLLGPNGAGKTTLLRCLLGLLRPSAGAIRVLGMDTATLAPRTLARRIAYVPQRATSPFPFTALDIAVMGRTPHLRLVAAPSEHDRRAAQAQLDQLGIGHLASRAFSALSDGERQLTLLARALVQDTEILVLDEPTSALDYGNETRMLHIVAELATGGRSVLMTTHQPAHALAYGDRAVLMRRGVVVADGPAAEVVTGAALSELYNTPIHVTEVVVPDAGAGRRVRTCVPLGGA